MPNIIGAFTDELGDVAKSIGSEVAKLPGDIAGSALESMGLKGVKSGSGKSSTTPALNPDSISGKFDKMTDPKERQAHARFVLAEMAGQVDLYGAAREARREPSVREKLEAEAEQKKQLVAQQKAAEEAQKIAMPTSKPARGDLYGAGRAKTKAERKVTSD